jgi:3-deoxy-D-manno-octulosonic acid kinase
MSGPIQHLLETSAGYARGGVGATTLIARSDLVERLESLIRRWGSLYEWAAAHARANAIRGRDTLYIVPGPDDVPWVVRRLTHGGLLAPLTGRRFLRVGLPRPFNELRVAERLRELGVPTPAVLAAVIYRSGPFYRGEVARRALENATDLAGCLFGEGLDVARRLEAMEAAGGLVGRMHRVGLVHPDLNLRNILIEWTVTKPTAHILDLEKCRFARLGPLRRRRMLARLQRSARRFEEESGDTISAEGWKRFRKAYSESERLL